MGKKRFFTLIFTLGTILSMSQLQSAGAADSAKIEAGKDLYNQNCVFCHQADAIGKVGFAPSLTNKEFL